MNRKQQFFDDEAKGEWNKVLTLDPGTRNTGFAFWDQLKKGKKIKPTMTGVQRVNAKIPWEKAVSEQCIWLGATINALQVEHVVIEFQEFWADSAKSYVSTSTGKLFKLCYLVGGYGEVVRANCILGPVLASPREWKGQMGKEVVDRRIKKAIKEEYKDHESDAVGIGLAMMGIL